MQVLARRPPPERTVLAFATLAIAALYLTVWPHELAHSAMAYLQGCKANWWRTGTSWVLWDSRGGEIDYACLERRGRLALGLTDFAGIGVNLLLLTAAAVVGRWWKAWPPARARTEWLLVATVLWGGANYAEAFSYLVLNVLWLKSDMATVVAASGVNRWLWLCGTMPTAVIVGRGLRRPVAAAAASLAASFGSPEGWRRGLVRYIAATAVVMTISRIVLT